MIPSIPKWARIAGVVLHGLIAAVMLFAGSAWGVPPQSSGAEQLFRGQGGTMTAELASGDGDFDRVAGINRFAPN